MGATFWWILGSGLAMSALALVGSVTLLLREHTLARLVHPLVALAAGSLLGGALFHLLPEAVEQTPASLAPFLWAVAGFLALFAVELLLRREHGHRLLGTRLKPLVPLLLLADMLHNFIGGLVAGAAFVADIRLGIAVWLAEAAHEVPQELGDFGALIQGGLAPRHALLFNFLSALTYPAGALLAYQLSAGFNVSLLVPIAAGNFLYVAAADLLPEVKEHRTRWGGLLHLALVTFGLGLMLLIRLLLG